jgi:hypothetical protein
MEKANKSIKTVHLEITMYRKTERQLPLENFHLPFGGELDPDNRWIKLANIIPWDHWAGHLNSVIKSNGNWNGFTRKSAIPLKVSLVKVNAVTGWAGLWRN